RCTTKYYKKIKGRKRQKLTCNFKISIFHGTWFERAHTDIVKICRFIAYFVMIRVPRHQFIMSELQLNNNTVKGHDLDRILKRQKPIGGNGKIVEIDEAKIGKRKYNTGRIIRGQWIIGGIERKIKNLIQNIPLWTGIMRPYFKSDSITERLQPSINVDIILHKGLQYIQESINDVVSTKQKCPKCDNPCHINEEYGPHIIIDVSVLSDPNYIKNIGLQSQAFPLQSIAKYIVMGNKKYILGGVINFLGNARHYTALIHTNVKWYEYDDLRSKRVEVSSTYKVVPHVLLYVIE
ncbi:hypothetical protein ALC57_13209, partial [Trachymyrmex cornetzi]